MTFEDLGHLALYEVEWLRYVDTRTAELIAALNTPDAAYPSTLIGLTEAHTAFAAFPSVQWWGDRS